MTPRERFLTAMCNRVPDRVPVTPDISNYIPCKLTGLPFWDIYFFGHVPLWKAYLNAADRYGIEAWMAACTGAPLTFEPSQAEVAHTYEYRQGEKAMVRHTTIRTPSGTLTEQSLCFHADPPSPIEKPIKDLAKDFAAFQCARPFPAGIDQAAWNEMREACERRQQAFGVSIGYPGFQGWFVAVEGGVTPLAYAEADQPELLERWFEWDLACGTRAMELILAAKPDYILLGGSGTITLASPDLARKYAIPALKKWSAMAKATGVPTMLHSCGRSRVLVDMLCEETDVNCINPLEIPPMGDVNLAEVKRARGKQIALMGNLHTTEIMLKGTVQQVKAAARQAIADAGEGGGFILSSGDQCPRDTPEANLFALVETAREHGQYAPDGTLLSL